MHQMSMKLFIVSLSQDLNAKETLLFLMRVKKNGTDSASHALRVNSTSTGNNLQEKFNFSPSRAHGVR
jgi:hypothetical protein